MFVHDPIITWVCDGYPVSIAGRPRHEDQPRYLHSVPDSSGQTLRRSIVFRSTGPRSRRPSTPVAPRDAASTRRQTAVLQTVQLIVASVDPRPESGAGARPSRADLRREAVIRYLQAQGGAVRNERGRVTAHLRAATGQGAGLGRLLRELEVEGVLTREVRGTRTYAVRLNEVTRPTGGTADPPACPGPVDYATFARALQRIVTTRLAATDPANCARREELESYQARIGRDLAEYEAGLGRTDGVEYFERKLEVIADLVSSYEAQVGIRIDDALTDAEHERLHGVLRTIRRP